MTPTKYARDEINDSFVRHNMRNAISMFEPSGKFNNTNIVQMNRLNWSDWINERLNALR